MAPKIEKKDVMEKSMVGGIIAIMGLLIMTSVVQAMTPVAQYCCPICPECFFTYDELYQHFITEHPSQAIDIIWE